MQVTCYVLIGCIRQVNDVIEVSSNEQILGYQFIAADSIGGGTTSSLTRRVAALEICKALKVIAFAPRIICIYWMRAQSFGIYVPKCKGIHNAFLLNACTVQPNHLNCIYSILRLYLISVEVFADIDLLLKLTGAELYKAISRLVKHIQYYKYNSTFKYRIIVD